MRSFPPTIRPRRQCPLHRSNGFTLIELLVGIAILAMLIALTLGAVGKTKEKMLTTASVLQLRQVGVGIQLYANENEMQLPGPLYTTIAPRFRSSDFRQLPTVIAPYLGYTPDNTWQTMKEMVFDSWKRHIGSYNPTNDQPKTLVCNDNDYDRAEIPTRPFGYPGSQAWSSSPVRLNQINALEKLWLVKEAPCPSADGKTIYPNGGKRMFLFASGRVSLENPDFYSYRP